MRSLKRTSSWASRRGATRALFTIAASITLGALGALAPSGAFAQDAPAAKAETPEEAKAQARELANKGFDLYQAGNYKEAIQYFRDAESHFHAPTILMFQANAHEKIGELIEARGLYAQIAREPLPPNATDEFKKAHADAEEGLGKFKNRIPKLRIVLKGPKPEKLQITIDNIPVANSILERPLEVNPGVRKVVATIETPEGGRSVFQTVTLRENRIKQITIVLRAGGGAMVAPPTEDESMGDSEGGSLVPAGIAFGVGGAGVAVGLVTGLLWMNERSLIKEACPNGDACKPDIQMHIDKKGTLGIAAIVGFSAGGVGLATGTILALTRKPAKTLEVATGVTSVAIGPGSITVRGAF